MTNDFQSQIMANKKTGLASFLTLLLAVTCLAILLNHRARSASRVQVGTPTATTFRPDQSTESEVAARYGTLPLSFELNQGQVDQQVKFLSHGPGYDLFLTDTGAVLTLTRLPARKDANAKTSLTDKEIGDETLPCSALR